MKEKKRVLIADPHSDLIQEIIKDSKSRAYIFDVASNGSECLEKIYSFHPDLVVIDLLLTEVHGIEILKKIRKDEKLKNIGVIISSAYPLLQNYRVSLEQGADSFISKPFTVDSFFSTVDDYFAGKLSTAFKKEVIKGEDKVLEPFDNPCLKFYGTRGSLPVSGPSFVRYGGNTCCLMAQDGESIIIIDAGSGIFPLGNSLFNSPIKNLHLFISHLHWDHIIGLPFFAPLYNPDMHITIWSPVGFEKSTEELLNEMFHYSFFPVRLDEVQAKIAFKELRPGPGQEVSIGKIKLETFPTFHPCFTLCFKISINQKLVGYATDNEIFMGYHGHPKNLVESDGLKPYKAILDFLQGCDTIIHEAQYFPSEYRQKVGWGHSSISTATGLIKYCQPREWIITHHDPAHNDLDLDKKLQLHRILLSECDIDTHVCMAYDNLVIPI